MKNEANLSWRVQKCNKKTKSPKGNNYVFNEKTCQDCGTLFMPTGGTQLYCKKCKADRYADQLIKSMGEDAYI